MKKPIVLTIMDGFGFDPDKNGNAIYTAKAPCLDKIFKECPTTQIGASGMDHRRHPRQTIPLQG